MLNFYTWLAYSTGEEALEACKLSLAKPQPESVHSIQPLGPGGG